MPNIHDAIAKGLAEELGAVHSKLDMIGENLYSWLFSTYIEKDKDKDKEDTHRYQTIHVYINDGKIGISDRIQYTPPPDPI